MGCSAAVAGLISYAAVPLSPSPWGQKEAAAARRQGHGRGRMRSAAEGEHRTGEDVAKRTLGAGRPWPTVPG